MRNKKGTGLLLFMALFTSIMSFAQLKPNQTFNTQKMKEYILLIRLPLSYGPKQAQAVREKWTTLINQWKAEGIFVTSFIGPADGYVITGVDKTVAKASIVSNDSRFISNIIINATDIEHSVQLAKLCPILDQGGTIEIRETQPRTELTNKDIIRNLYEHILNNRKIELLNDIISPDYVGIGGVK